MSGRRIGSYELLELLGEGGIGQVYAARDTELGRHVAIKMLRRELSRDHSFLSRFHNEARSLGNLNHQNITILYTFQLEGPNPFMVMELVRGETLEALLSRVRRLPLRESLAVVAQAVAGLAYAHRNGVIHRDIKPSNLMIADSGLLKIMDFGIARVRGSQRLTRAGQMFATLLYASPEQIKGNDVDERSDLYSLGVVLYEMIAGSPPFTAENDHALMTAHLETPPPPLAARVQSLDAQIEAAVLRALAKRPEDRFASVEEFGRAVGAAAFRGDSSDILQQFATTTWRGAAPRTRIAEAANNGTEIWDEAGGDGVGGSPKAEIPRRRVAPNRPKAPPAGMRLPVAILGGVVIALALGLGYVVLWSRAPTETHLAAIEPPKPMPYAAPAPTPPAPTSPAPAPYSAPAPPATAVAEPPKPAPEPAPRANPQPSPSSMPVPVVFPPPASLPGEPPLAPAKPSPALLLPPMPPPEASPPEAPPTALEPSLPAKPDIEGQVTSVQSASTVKVGANWLELYGIIDQAKDRSSELLRHKNAMLKLLGPSRGLVKCYRKPGGRYQCYADGNDLASLALRDGIVRPLGDAPAEYRELATPPASLRR